MSEEESSQRTAVVIRNIQGADAVEWFLVLAVATILVTRLYLKLAGYPQIGGGQLHIAHALWGGVLMVLALVVSWLFIGATPRLVSITLAGIGFGLFLDEVGKFVTKANDYFYGPSAEIMYVAVVVILLIARIVRDVKRPTVPEALANAAAIATDGVGHGLPARLRSQAESHLDVAEERGADRRVLENIRGLIDTSKGPPDVLTRLRDGAADMVPAILLERWVVALVGWTLSGVSAVLLAVWVLAHASDPKGIRAVDGYLQLDHGGPATHILLVAGVATVMLAVPATIAWTRGSTALWPLRWLRLAAMVFTFSNALVDFAVEGFSALVNLAVGLAVLAVVSYNLVQRAAQYAGHPIGEQGRRAAAVPPVGQMPGSKT